MTKSRYPHPGCATWSQVYGEADGGVASSAWNVNTNNGNVNNNDRNNNGFALAARRVGEFQGDVCDVPLRALFEALRRAKRQKVPSHNQLSFDMRWMDGLLELQRELIDHNWSPRPSTCFIAIRPKAREIHAPDFADRVVHHWLVPQLEAIYESRFIHDSYANRTGKGSHAAVRRAKDFVRQVHSGQGGGWYLQMDIHNFFNSIHRQTLWAMLKPRLQRAGLNEAALKATHALLRHDPLSAGVTVRATSAELAQVPPQKRLANAAPGCGVTIGNLSSQFLANVYLDALDQFVKHELKVKRYLRYVDDFVLFHHDREQLVAWQSQIVEFLATRLRLKLKADTKLLQLTDGLDFLGYVIHPAYTRVRQRVITHAREALQVWEAEHVRAGQLRGMPEDFRHIRSVVASYYGHLRHANCYRLQQQLLARFPWITAAVRPWRFSHRLEGRRISIPFGAAP